MPPPCTGGVIRHVFWDPAPRRPSRLTRVAQAESHAAIDQLQREHTEAIGRLTDALNSISSALARISPPAPSAPGAPGAPPFASGAPLDWAPAPGPASWGPAAPPVELPDVASAPNPPAGQDDQGPALPPPQPASAPTRPQPAQAPTQPEPPSRGEAHDAGADAATAGRNDAAPPPGVSGNGGGGGDAGNGDGFGGGGGGGGNAAATSVAGPRATEPDLAFSSLAVSAPQPPGGGEAPTKAADDDVVLGYAPFRCTAPTLEWMW